jgi:hypothetical protein
MKTNRAARFMTHELAFAQGYVRTPGGFRHKSFVHRLAPGQAVSRRSGRVGIVDLTTRRQVELPAPVVPAQDLSGMGGGWVAWADWTNATGTPVSSFLTTWVVPPPPVTQSGQLIYLFNALEDQAGDNILQPVLQWGESGAGGGNDWGVASWYVDSSHHAFCTPVIPVNPGDTLIGELTLVSQGDGLFNYSSAFQGRPATALIAQGLSKLVLATETLEVYGLTKSSDYPDEPATRMRGIDIRTGANPAPVQWAPEVMDNPSFAEHTTVVSNQTPGGEVDLCY